MDSFNRPMTQEERDQNIGNPLKAPNRFHLVDCLKDLKLGAPADRQHLIDYFIQIALDKGNVIHDTEDINDIIDGAYCPPPIETIPNNMVINLNSVRNIWWGKNLSGGLTYLTINFKKD